MRSSLWPTFGEVSEVGLVVVPSITNCIPALNLSSHRSFSTLIRFDVLYLSLRLDVYTPNFPVHQSSAAQYYRMYVYMDSGSYRMANKSKHYEHIHIYGIVSIRGFKNATMPRSSAEGACPYQS